MSRGIREVTVVDGSEREIVLERAAVEKVTKVEDSGIVTRKIQGVPVTQGADTEPQLPEDPQEVAKGHNIEGDFLHPLKKSDFKVIAAGTAVNVVTGREKA